MKQFPGIPPGFEQLSEVLSDAATRINSENTERGKQTEKIFAIMARCTSKPPAYFDLYSALLPFMPELFTWWNTEIVNKKASVETPEGLLIQEISQTEGISEKIQDLGVEGFNIFLALCATIRQMKNGEDTIEAFTVLDSVLWCVYISMMRDDFFEKIYKAVLAVGKREASGKSDILFNTSPN
jgi:hypothetical protein